MDSGAIKVTAFAEAFGDEDGEKTKQVDAAVLRALTAVLDKRFQVLGLEFEGELTDGGAYHVRQVKVKEETRIEPEGKGWNPGFTRKVYIKKDFVPLAEEYATPEADGTMLFIYLVDDGALPIPLLQRVLAKPLFSYPKVEVFSSAEILSLSQNVPVLYGLQDRKSIRARTAPSQIPQIGVTDCAVRFMGFVEGNIIRRKTLEWDGIFKETMVKGDDPIFVVRPSVEEAVTSLPVTACAGCGRGDASRSKGECDCCKTCAACSDIVTCVYKSFL